MPTRGYLGEPHASGGMVAHIRIERLTGAAAAFASLGYPRLAPVLDMVAAPWVAVGAWCGAVPVGLALGQIQQGIGQLLSLMVVQPLRGRGIGTRLAAAWEEAAATAGVSGLRAGCSSRLAGRPALAATLARAGWSEPRLADISCIGEVGPMVAVVAQWPGVASRLRHPGDITFEPWQPLDPSGASALAGLAAEPDFVAHMHPDSWAGGIEPVCSVAVRRKGELVGWVLGERTDRVPLDGYRDRPAIHYVSAYLARSLWHTGILVAAYWHAYHRQSEWLGPHSIAFFHTPLPRMMALVRRRFAPIALCVDEAFAITKNPPPRPEQDGPSQRRATPAP